MKTPPSLTGGAFFYGRIKSGKTCAMMSLAGKYHDNPMMGYKIIDLYGGHRKESLYWTIPSNDEEYWRRVRKVLDISDSQELPVQYKVNLLYPCFISNLPNKLLSNPPYVKSKIFTIPFKEVVGDDIRLVINSVSQQTHYYWEEVLGQTKKTDGGAKLSDIFIKMQAENSIFYRNFIVPLIKECFLQSQVCSYNLDILAELKDRETISVLCLDFVPPMFHLFIMGWFLRKTAELIDLGKVRTKNIILAREASEWFKATNDSIMEDRVKFFRNLLANWIRYGRRGMHIFLDTQSPAETKGCVEGSQDLTLLGRIAGTSKRDRAEVAESLYSVGKMTKKQIRDLNDLRSGEFFMIEGYKDARKVYFLLPRSSYWKEGDGNFYSHVWKAYVDKWLNIDADKSTLLAEYEESEKKFAEERKFKNQLEKQNKQKIGRPKTDIDKDIGKRKTVIEEEKNSDNSDNGNIEDDVELDGEDEKDKMIHKKDIDDEIDEEEMFS